jgi:hypothetical protein
MDYEIKLEGQVANNPVVADGTPMPIKFDKNGNLSVIFGHAKYREAVSRGRVNIASNAVTGVAMGTAFSTTPPFSIWNPFGSNVTLSILKTTVAYLSGTLSYGIISYATVIQATQPSSGTEIVAKNALIGSVRGVAYCSTGATQTAGTVLYSPYSFGVQAATTALGVTTCQDVVDGMVCVPPGYAFIIQSTSAGAGSTPLCVMGAIWEEIPIV